MHFLILSLRRTSLSGLLLAVLVLAGCDSSPPSNSWENAVKGFYSAALSDDGRHACLGSIHHGGSFWRIDQGERLYDWNHKKGEYSNIIACGFSPEGNYALTADHQTMVLWDTQTGAAATFWTAPSEVLDIDLSDNGNYALLGLGDYSAVLFNVKRGGIERSFYHDNKVRAVAISSDGKLALTGSDDASARLWDLDSGQQRFRWDFADQVVTVAFSPAGDRALTVAKYDRAAIWDTNSGKQLGVLPLTASAIKRGQSFSSARFSADGRQLLTGNADRLVQLWDVDNFKELASWTVPKRDRWKPTSASIVAVAFAPQSKQYLAIASNGFSHKLQRKD